PTPPPPRPRRPPRHPPPPPTPPPPPDPPAPPGPPDPPAPPAPPAPPEQSAHVSSSHSSSRWQMHWDDNGSGFEVDLRGTIAFTDDLTDVQSLSDGGSFT